MSSPAFVHLKLHSEFSLVDSVLRLDEIIQQAKECGMPAVAVTDHVNLFGLVKFYRKAIAAGIKPIIGADLLIQEGEVVFEITALCKDETGYRHLRELLSIAYLEGQKNDQALLSRQHLFSHKAGLIILSGGRKGDVGQALLAGNTVLAKQQLQTWIEHFPDHFYLSVERTSRESEEAYLHAAVALASEYDVPLVASNAVRFLERFDFEAHEARVCIHEGYVLEDSSRPREYSDQQYFKSTEEMAELFSDLPEALENTVEIAKRCNVKLTLGEVFLPKFPVPENMTEAAYFSDQTKAGLEARFNQLPDKTPEERVAYVARLETELAVIANMGFAGYFLIVADFISWSKAHDIPVGPGRGSGAGSLVAYALGITAVDPLEHELLFERFLNPERVSMPDFDIDFCMEGRDRVIDYVAERYGQEAVSQIITYGTMAAKAVVRDVGRVLGFPYGFVDKVAKLVPFELGITLEKALQQEPLFLERYKKEEEVKTLIDLARKLEGLTRNAGKHAGGLVIAPTKLTDFVPLFCEPGGQNVVTQFDKDDVESVGLVKFDFLGLRTLTIIDWAVQSVNKKRKALGELPLDITTLPLDDQATFDLLKRCETTAVFQLESRGMKDLIRRLQPDQFEEITALVALFRPGPLQSGMVDDFIARKHGRERVQYPHPDIEGLLKPTYGVILYQEQVMQIAQVLAGYSLGGADILRRAMGKKKPEEMAKQRKVFIDGAAKRDIDAKVAEYIFDLIEKFSGYGFNKSHSAAYALLAYQTAWLKAHYPAEFMAAVLSSDMDNTDKVVGFIEECRDMKLKLVPPNVNRGFYHFTVNDAGEIEYGLGAVKGVGEAAVQHLVECREQGGAYKSLFDLCQRLDGKTLNRRALEPLVRSGAMDVFEVPRACLFASIDKAMRSADQEQRNAALGQDDLFGGAMEEADIPVDYETVPDWSDAERLQGEKDSLGLYVSGHPLQACEKELAGIVTAPISGLRASSKGGAVVAGMLVGLRVITTKNNRRLAIMTLEDRSGRTDVTLFGETYQGIAPFLEGDPVLIIKGTASVDEYSGGFKVMADKVVTLDQWRERLAKRILIRVKDHDQIEAILSKLPGIIREHNAGSCPITIAYQGGEAGAELKLGEAWRVKPSTALLTQLYQLCGADNVTLEY